MGGRKGREGLFLSESMLEWLKAMRWIGEGYKLACPHLFRSELGEERWGFRWMGFWVDGRRVERIRRRMMRKGVERLGTMGFFVGRVKGLKRHKGEKGYAPNFDSIYDMFRSVERKIFNSYPKVHLPLSLFHDFVGMLWGFFRDFPIQVTYTRVEGYYFSLRCVDVKSGTWESEKGEFFLSSFFFNFVLLRLIKGKVAF